MDQLPRLGKRELICQVKSSQNFIQDHLTEGMRTIQHTNKSYIEQVMNNYVVHTNVCCCLPVIMWFLGPIHMYMTIF